MGRLRMGVLGAGGIAGHFAVASPGFQNVEVVAIGSRSRSKAEDFASKYGLATSYGSYQAVVDDPNLDCVYIALPNGLHKEWTLACLRAGKHVLCEKPMALTRSDAEEMFSVAEELGLVLLEGFPYRFQPQTLEVLRRVHSGELGDVISITACFGFRMRDPNNVRLDPTQGGGATWDVGVYPVNLALAVIGETPISVFASSRLNADGLDLTTTAVLEFAGGVQASMWSSFESATFRRANIVGTEGAIEYAHNNHPLTDASASFLLQKGHGADMTTETIACKPGNGFVYEAEAFADVVAGNRQLQGTTPGQTLAGIAVVESILKSIRLGQRVNVG